MNLITVLWALLGFASGSLMFSLWIGRLALRSDIRAVGDGNPGATNVLKAGGIPLGLLALLLDALKGAIPVAIAKYGFGIGGGLPLVIVALAPVFGHAFSPFVGFKGGKAIAVTAGVWTAITFWEFPTLGGIALGIWFAVVASSGWAVLLTGLCLFAYYLLVFPDPALIALLLVNLALVTWKYRADLRAAPALRGWLNRCGAQS